MAELTHLSLFSGIGGLDLAAERAGFRTVGQCEWADYPTKVLEKHWPDVPRWRDIRTLTGDDFYERTGLRTVDVISGGFPCQPFSVAGKRRGKEDDRFLWPEMLRVVSELRPAWVVGENVAGIVSMAIDQALSDLESIGYTCQAFVIPACAVDAPHRRDRCAIVANSQSARNRGLPVQPRRPQQTHPDAFRGGKDVADADRHRLQRRKQPGAFEQRREKKPHRAACERGKTADYTNSSGQHRDDRRKEQPELAHGCWWPTEPDVGRVANGVPCRVDRLKCLGNAVVPAQFYPIFQAIADVEMLYLKQGGNEALHPEGKGAKNL